MMEKIAFIGHSFHLKTQSDEFFIKLVERHFVVEQFYDGSWEGKAEVDLRTIDESYRAVIFWQLISPAMLKQVKCRNIIFVPMYDQSGSMKEWQWYKYRNFKILCFSSTMQKMLNGLGFNTLGVQYFPEEQKEEDIEPDTCFFWQRRNEITWNSVKMLLANSGIRNIHIHKAVDPTQQFVQPTAEDERLFKIEYSDWFETKDEYLSAMGKKQIYIAPRMQEGIGFSFLEAMARGQVVVAANQPTMNEYIKDGYNGYLYDIDNMQPISFGNLSEVSENAIITIKAGHETWLKQESDIIGFIESETKINDYFAKHKLGRLRGISIKRILINVVKYVLPYGIVLLLQYLKRQILAIQRKRNDR